MSHTARKLLEQKKFDPIIATLSDKLGTDEAAALWVRAERRLDALLKTTDGLSKEEKAHVEGFIMPTCALYQEMAAAMGREEALALLMDFAHDLALQNRRAFERMVSVPGGKALFLRGFAAVQPRAFGESAGFSVRSSSHDGSHVHFDITRCPYQRVTAELGTPELCNLFCTNDDIIYGDLPGIRFSRKGTLGRGDAACDFDVSLARGMAEEPRKLLLVGVGVIGSYLTQVLCEAGHDVSVVARGGWADTIERDGLKVHHYLQRKETITGKEFMKIFREAKGIPEPEEDEKKDSDGQGGEIKDGKIKDSEAKDGETKDDANEKSVENTPTIDVWVTDETETSVEQSENSEPEPKEDGQTRGRFSNANID